jgi:ABC-type glycerol-3-phosphate transport system substrate-binding protein
MNVENVIELNVDNYYEIVEKVRTMIQTKYPDIIDDGEIETGTEEWFDVLIDLGEIYGIKDITYDDLYNNVVPDFDTEPLWVVFEELGVEVY